MKREEQVVEVNAPLDCLICFVRALHERTGFSYSSLSVEYTNGQPRQGIPAAETVYGTIEGASSTNAQGKSGGQGLGTSAKEAMQRRKEEHTRVRNGGGISKHRKRHKRGMQNQFKPGNLPPRQRQQKHSRRGY